MFSETQLYQAERSGAHTRVLAAQSHPPSLAQNQAQAAPIDFLVKDPLH
jgi:hypothetical protein